MPERRAVTCFKEGQGGFRCHFLTGRSDIRAGSRDTAGRGHPPGHPDAITQGIPTPDVTETRADIGQHFRVFSDSPGSSSKQP